MENLQTLQTPQTHDKLLIIDGSNLLFQMFFGMPSRIINKDGKAIQGTLGFVGALIKIIKMTVPTHVIILFDSETENERVEINADYKANRTDYSNVLEEENPFSQIDDVYAALDFMKIKHTEVKGVETDDVIASYTLTSGKTMQIVISSFDSDFFQLITKNVSVLRYRGDKTVICDEEYIMDKLGIIPSLYADYKSLTGDASDNIKGVRGIGSKTAAQLINTFGDLKNILTNIDKFERMSVKEAIQAESERLQQNYKLIKLDNRAQIPFTVEELVYEYDGITTTEVLKGIGLK